MKNSNKENTKILDLNAKKERGDSVDISLEAYKRLSKNKPIENRKTDGTSTNGITKDHNQPNILDHKQTQMMFVKKEGVKDMVVVFKDKKTGDVVAEIPSKNAIENNKRLKNFLDNITLDLLA